MSDESSVTQLLKAVGDGRPGAAERLFSVVYDDLRALAQRQLRRGRPGQTLGTTALVHETYLKLVDRSQLSPENRAHFFAVAARAMRQLIVDHVRTARAEKRGGGTAHLDLGEAAALLQSTTDPADRALDVLEIDRALEGLDRQSPRLRQVVELRFFGGFSVEETAEVMGTSPRTVKRDWQLARAFLFRELRGHGAGDAR